MSHAYVLVEHSASGVDAVTAELMTAARAFGEVRAVVVGKPGMGQELAADLGNSGADLVIAAESTDDDARFLIPAVDALSMLATADPGPIVIAGDPAGAEIGARLAARLASGVVFDVVDVNSDRTARHAIFGDSMDTTAAVGGASPVYVVRRGAIPARSIPAAGTLQHLSLPPANELDARVTAFEPAVSGARPELTEARVVLSLIHI